ncbi:MAG TPA: MMPL family transporter, partial [Dehalococcoidia bacterium]|nr:MMPL family transporter [Dehalococcoidia bacterium]
GLSLTTRLISAAAAIMVAVFLSFAFAEQRVIKEFGVGLATAVFLDATVVRLVLVPSVMQLLGDANWWFPAALDRVLPRLAIERPPIEDRRPALSGAGARERAAQGRER